jgi:hypothetical protein
MATIKRRIMTFLWKFEAKIRGSGAAFFLDEEIPFLGDYRHARAQAQLRKTRWERQNRQTIDHVEPSFCVRPDKQQIPVSMLKLAGYAMVGAVALGRADEHTSHNLIVLEKDGRRELDTIQDECWQAADRAVKDYLATARQKERFDICVVAYNGVVIRDHSIERAFISRMYGPGLGDNNFIFQSFRPASRTVAIAFTGTPKLNLGNHTLEQTAVWLDILMAGFLQHPEAFGEWSRIKHICRDRDRSLSSDPT